jgi:hypothetical protein
MRPVAAVVLLKVAAGLLAAIGLLTTLSGCSRVEPPSPQLLAQAQGDQCVEETAFMRRAHMDLLMVERDQAKRLGQRNADHSFVGCINCHVAPTASKAEPSSHFCLACHSFNAVRMDCFECHLDRPAGTLSHWMGHDPTPSMSAWMLGSGLPAREFP